MFANLFRKIAGINKKASRSSVDNWFVSDRQFNKLYPKPMQALAKRHWTPLAVARKAAAFLAVDNGVKILDIGSGVGKFCLSAGYYKPNATYCGIEQRQSLINYAEDARNSLGFTNVSFIQGNFTQLNLREYNHFYFYNSFYENLPGIERIDDSIAYSAELFKYYTSYFIQQLEEMPAGTRLATYHSTADDVPPGFTLVSTEVNDLLKCWIKK